MDAATLTTFCAVRELSFVEQGVREGAKGAWFENRRRQRTFFSDDEITQFAARVHEHPVPRQCGVVSFTS
ncbi:MAG: hypothetical protein IT463_05290 [Planctomycetes bacterium]|nr:hypothetical protein [Planctomycetota bacterium]